MILENNFNTPLDVGSNSIIIGIISLSLKYFGMKKETGQISKAN